MDSMKQPENSINTDPSFSNKKIKKTKSSKKSSVYQGYNFDFSQEKDKTQKKLEEDFQPLFEDYEIIQSIGKGSYGLVVKAMNRKTNQLVAIKKYIHLYRDKIDSKRILREIAILRRLEHPNIVKLYDIIIPDLEKVDSLYLVMELCDTDLKSLLYNQKTVLSETQIKKIMFDILSGLNFIHKCGVIHRDLKPANIVINLTACEAKICDFGLARDMTLEYDTEKLLNFFFADSNNKLKFDCDNLKMCLSSEAEIAPDLQDLLQENLEAISEGLFKKYSEKYDKKEDMLFDFDEPKNLLKEIEKHRYYIDSNDYYTTYENLFLRDSKLRKNMTPHVITRWYRAPEVILLEPIYTSYVDIWSVGCIFGELLGKLKGNKYGGPLFPGNTCHPLSPFIIQKDGKTIIELSNDDQLLTIFKVLGSPQNDEIQFISNRDALEHVRKIGKICGRSMMEMYPACHFNTIQLLLSMLKFDPRSRISCQDAIINSYFINIKEYIHQKNPDKFDNLYEKLIVLDFDSDDNSLGFHDIKNLFLREYNHFNKSKNQNFGININIDVNLND